MNAQEQEKIIASILDNSHRREAFDITLHRLIANTLTKWEGKKINRRIVKEIKQALAEAGFPEVIVHYEQPGAFARGQVQLWGGGLTGHEDFNKQFWATLRMTHSAEAFEEDNRCSGSAAEERNVRRRARTKEDVKKLVKAIVAYLEAKAEVELQIESFDEDKYAIERAVGLRND